VDQVTFLAVWGNHSSTMYPDYFNARIGGKRAVEVIADEAWVRDQFLPAVQQRGAAIIKARGLSSAASAANAAIETVRSLISPTQPGDCFSVATCSDGSYGIEKGLIYSFPTRANGAQWEVIQGVSINEFSREKLSASEAELKEEKALVTELLP
jgi:malate dehydrogenase